MAYKNILILTKGYIGEKLLQIIKELKLKPIIATTNLLNMEKSNNILSFSSYFQIYQVNGDHYIEENILPKVDFIICIDWKKDYFKNIKPACPIYYMQPALLPKYRGYGAISEQFIRGVVQSGITIYEYNGIIDAGDIIYQKEIKIEMYYKVSDFIDMVAKCCADFIFKLYNGEKFTKIKQQEEYAFYLPKIRKNSRKIDFNAGAISVYNFIRAYTFPYSYAFFYYKNEEYKITDVALESWAGVEGKCGEVIKINDYGLIVACGEGSILIKEVEYNNEIMKALRINIFDSEILL